MDRSKIRLEPIDSSFKLALVTEIAAEVWRECYADILAKDQIEYMLRTIQSRESIRKDIVDNDFKYYLLLWDDIPAGYSAVQMKNKKCFLSKLYVKNAHRDKKVASYAMAFFERMALLDGMTHIWLTCNIHNTRAIETYKRWGFEIVDKQQADIGQGYIMDDYIMEKPL